MSSAPILPNASDERLLELFVAGDERSFEIVVRRYRTSLVGYCRRLGLSESRAEDAVQQCFLSALLALRRGDSVRDLRAWLGRIAHNVAVNMMRSGGATRETGLAADWGAEDRAIHIPDMDGGIAAREALAEVAALPPMQREALLQSALGGRTYGEVAASMGLSEGAVRGLLHRARATLRSAAAIFSPLPLMRRASGWLGGGGSGGRLAELTAPGGSSALGGTAVRALGAGVTAIVVAAGVAVAPHGGSHAARHPSASLPSPPPDAAVPASGGPVSRDSSKAATQHVSASAAPGKLTAATGVSPGAGNSTPAGRAPGKSRSRNGGSGGSPSSESTGRTVEAGTSPAQVSAVTPSSPGTLTQPSAPPVQEPVAKEPTKTKTGEETAAEERERELAEERREREAEEARERVQAEEEALREGKTKDK